MKDIDCTMKVEVEPGVFRVTVRTGPFFRQVQEEPRRVRPLHALRQYLERNGEPVEFEKRWAEFPAGPRFREAEREDPAELVAQGAFTLGPKDFKWVCYVPLEESNPAEVAALVEARELGNTGPVTKETVLALWPVLLLHGEEVVNRNLYTVERAHLCAGPCDWCEALVRRCQSRGGGAV